MAFGLKTAVITVSQSEQKVPGPSVKTKLAVFHPAEGNGGDVFVGGPEAGGIYISLQLSPLVIVAPAGGELDLSQFYASATQGGDSVIFVYLDYAP